MSFLRTSIQSTYKAYKRVDANLRQHIGTVHKMKQYLFKLQKKGHDVKQQSIPFGEKKDYTMLLLIASSKMVVHSAAFV